MLIIRMIILLIFLLPLTGLANGESQKTKPNHQTLKQDTSQTKDKKEISKTQNSYTAPLPLQRNTPPPNLQKESTQKSNNRQNDPYIKWRSIKYSPVDVFTGILGFFTVLLVMAAGWQVAVARNTTKKQLRAWIGIKGINGPANAGKPLDVSIEFINVGKTPATNVTVYARAEPFDESTSPDFSKKYISKEEVSSVGVFIPQVPQACILSTSNKQPIDKAQIERITSGKQRLFVHGIIRYDDIFGYHHWTNYCYYLDTDGKSYVAYKEHNEIDMPKFFLWRLFSRKQTT